MQKDFDTWNTIKKEIDVEKRGKFYNAREIWWCSIGVNIGFEHNGMGEKFQRPILILKGLSSNTCLVAPLTSSEKRHPMRIPIGLISGRNASVVVSQIRVIDTRRLTEKVCYLEDSKFEDIRKTIKDML